MIKDKYGPIQIGSKYVTFTKREIEVLQLMAEGKNNREIGEELIISPHTAKAHVGNILHKMCKKDRVAAVAESIRKSIID